MTGTGVFSGVKVKVEFQKLKHRRGDAKFVCRFIAHSSFVVAHPS